MKILLLTNMYPNSRSIFGIFVKQQAEALKEKGVDVVIIARSRNKALSYMYFILKSTIYVLFSSYDLVHAHYGFHSALVPVLLKRKKLIVTFHGSDALIEPFRNKLYGVLQRLVVRRSDYIIAVSNDIKNALVERLGAVPEKITVISCGVNTDLFTRHNAEGLRKSLGIPPEGKIVLFVGKIDFMKGLDLLYECARSLNDVYFLFVGEGSLRTDLENCIFPGPVPNDEMPMWMSLADVFVLPSRSEGTPVVILEALSCGTPVISSAVGGCPDLIRDGQTGYLVPLGDVDTLRDRILDLVGSDSKRLEMGKQGRRDVVSGYDNAIVSRKIRSIYEMASGNRSTIRDGVSSAS